MYLDFLYRAVHHPEVLSLRHSLKLSKVDDFYAYYVGLHSILSRIIFDLESLERQPHLRGCPQALLDTGHYV